MTTCNLKPHPMHEIASKVSRCPNPTSPQTGRDVGQFKPVHRQTTATGMRFVPGNRHARLLMVVVGLLLLMASAPAMAQMDSDDGSSVGVVAISSGLNHTCALRQDGAAVCWGDDGYGQASVPEGETFTAISSGRYHTCALRQDGAAVCWGDDGYGQASAPPGETFTAISIAGYGYHTCALRQDGTAVCWGHNHTGQASPPGGTFTAISSGRDHTCALRQDGTAVCWGRNPDGQASPPEGRDLHRHQQRRGPHLRRATGRRRSLLGIR